MVSYNATASSLEPTSDLSNSG